MVSQSTDMPKNRRSTKSNRAHQAQVVSERVEEAEETLIADHRSELRPAELVEQKLERLLKNSTVPLSFFHCTKVRQSRRHC